MSLFAGVYARRAGIALDPDVTATIAKSISRLDDPINTFEDERFFIAKLDFGAFGEPALSVGATVAAATGEPFFNPTSDRPSSRASDLTQISEGLRSSGPEVLLECQGSFSFCQYRPAEKSLLLAADRVGLRPVYYHCGPDFVFFSSNLRILERLTAVPKRMDLRGVTETAVFGYTLGNRTPYADIKSLLGGHVLECRGDEITISRYFQWSDVPPTELDRDRLLDVAHQTFMDALECRSARDGVATSFLSGGMDSRVVVAGLRALGREVYTLTFESSGPKDSYIARLAAERLGTHHTTKVVGPFVGQQLLKATAAGESDYRSDLTPRFPSLIFSGDGGSVGLGFVYMEDPLVQLCRAGSTDDLLRHIGAYDRLPQRIFREEILHRIEDVVAQGVREEMARGGMEDPAKNYHLFLMNNDQRQHLWYLYEDIDRNRTEFLLPFFDGRFLELIASAPVDWFLLHRFYSDWMFKFPEAATAVPWQTYPGHVPCPIADEVPDSFRSQWQPTRREEFVRAKPAFRTFLRNYVGSGHPKTLIRRWPVTVAAVLHGLRARNYGYVWNIYNTFARFSTASAGRGDE